MPGIVLSAVRALSHLILAPARVGLTTTNEGLAMSDNLSGPVRNKWQSWVAGRPDRRAQARTAA